MVLIPLSIEKYILLVRCHSCPICPPKLPLNLACVLCHYGMVRPQVADGGDGPRIWLATANIFNKQSRTAYKRWFSSLRDGRVANNSSP
jgi:hypothetical protein